jgi:hypothetical protein
MEKEIELSLDGKATIGQVLDRLGSDYPMLHGTIREPFTKQRRPYVRFFACGVDVSLEGSEYQLPEAVTAGREPLRVIGAMAGG